MNRRQEFLARFLIPRGYYCRGCPFWSIDYRKPEQMNGYCSYLGKGDWKFYEEMPIQIEVKRKQSDGTYKRELIDKQPMFGGLLWDGCKECGVKV